MIIEEYFEAWEFLDYFNDREENEFLTWLDSIPLQAKAKINARINILRGFLVWPEQYVSSYKGWDDIVELKIVFSGVQYRPLGFYGPLGRWRFTLLVGGKEKGKIPKRLLGCADERRKIVLADKTRARPHDFS
jgi:hypothetical protein